MRKLVTQIPCYDEEASLPVTVGELPRSVPGFDDVIVNTDGDNQYSAACIPELARLERVRS